MIVWACDSLWSKVVEGGFDANYIPSDYNFMDKPRSLFGSVRPRWNNMHDQGWWVWE